MELIVISDSEPFQGEADLINSLFEAGMPVFHLRKVGINKPAYEQLIREIYCEYHDRIALHQFHELAVDFPMIKRFHYPERLRQEHFSEAADRRTCSTSIHHLDQLNELTEFDYTFYSPVFNSLSKPGYRGIADPDFILAKPAHCRTKVFALGGVEQGNLHIVEKMGFDGFAVLGAIWNDKANAIANFKGLVNRSGTFS